LQQREFEIAAHQTASEDLAAAREKAIRVIEKLRGLRLSRAHFRSWNEQAVIVRGADSVLDRREKTRPASAAIEFGFGAKERQIAGRTSEQTGAMLVIERAVRPRLR
jgi:hypothetical protein